MSLYDKWIELSENISEKEFEKFWDEYSSAEIKIYSDILASSSREFAGTFSELATKYDVSDALFMGFLDGVNTSVKEPLELEKIEADSAIALSIDFEELYFNMLASEAEHLYSLDEWDLLLSHEKREEITKDYKKSRTVIKEKVPGRNDPCSCGSGKKYKKCCGN